MAMGIFWVTLLFQGKPCELCDVCHVMRPQTTGDQRPHSTRTSVPPFRTGGGTGRTEVGAVLLLHEHTASQRPACRWAATAREG